jgi:hypothetical protein
MNTVISFEYYSTFAPVAGAFLADEPSNTPMNAYKNSVPLQSLDRGYCIYSARKPVCITNISIIK